MSARDRKAPPKARSIGWTAEELIERLIAGGYQKEAGIANAFVDWAQAQDLELTGGHGGQVASVYFRLKTDQGSCRPFFLYESYRGGVLHLSLDEMGGLFKPGSKPRAEFCAEMAEVLAVDVAPDGHYPSVPLTAFEQPDRMQGSLKIMEKVLRALATGAWE